jgi:hypothetical protein
LDIYVPQGLPSRACISLNAVIYVPDMTDFIALKVQILALM